MSYLASLIIAYLQAQTGRSERFPSLILSISLAFGALVYIYATYFFYPRETDFVWNELNEGRLWQEPAFIVRDLPGRGKGVIAARDIKVRLCFRRMPPD